VYQPRLLGFAEVVLTDRGKKFQRQRTYRLLAPPPEPGRPVAWEHAEEIGAELLTLPPENDQAVWSDVPETVNDPRKLRVMERSLLKYLYDHADEVVYHNRSFSLYSDPGESLESFLQRCKELARQSSAPELEKVRELHRAEVDALRASEQGTPAKVNKAMERWQADLDRVREEWDRKAEDIKEVRLAPRKTDIRVTHFGLGWAPFVRGEADGEPASAYARGREGVVLPQASEAGA
jgi:hypothetical protein